METVISLLESQANHYHKMQSAKFDNDNNHSIWYYEVMEDQFRIAIKILNGETAKRSEICSNDIMHKHYLYKLDYKFCPVCGMELQI